MKYRLVFSVQAEKHLAELEEYLTAAAATVIAANYIEGVLRCCHGLTTLPHCGYQRDDLKAGMRITNYRKRTVIAFRITGNLVRINGIFHGGRDYESVLRCDEREDNEE